MIASEAELDAAESAIGHRLPADLRAVLRVRDGGTAHFGTFRKAAVSYPLGAAFFGVGRKAAPYGCDDGDEPVRIADSFAELFAGLTADDESP